MMSPQLQMADHRRVKGSGPAVSLICTSYFSGSSIKLELAVLSCGHEWTKVRPSCSYAAALGIPRMHLHVYSPQTTREAVVWVALKGLNLSRNRNSPCTTFEIWLQISA